MSRNVLKVFSGRIYVTSQRKGYALECGSEQIPLSPDEAAELGAFLTELGRQHGAKDAKSIVDSISTRWLR